MLSDTLLLNATEYRRVDAPPVQPARWVGWRMVHDLERNDYNSANRAWGWAYTGRANGPIRQTVIDEGKGMPEVYRVGDFQTLLTPDWILLWRNMNLKLSLNKFCSLLDNKLAWTNGTGWPGRFNCLTGSEEGEKDPAFHICIVNGGAFLKGAVQGDNALIQTLPASGAVPTAEYVLARPWLWYWGTTITPNGRINYITRLGMDGQYYPVRVPLITSRPLVIPLAWMHRWERDELPDATQVYA